MFTNSQDWPKLKWACIYCIYTDNITKSKISFHVWPGESFSFTMVYTLSFLVNTDTEEVSNLLVVDMDESIHVHVYVCVCVHVWVHMPFLLQGKIFSETGFRLLKRKWKLQYFILCGLWGGFWVCWTKYLRLFYVNYTCYFLFTIKSLKMRGHRNAWRGVSFQNFM